MIGYQPRFMQSRAQGFTGGSKEEHALAKLSFPSRKRALQEGARRTKEPAHPSSFEVIEVDDADPHYVRWSEGSLGKEQEDVLLIHPSAIASSVIECYLRRTFGNYTLHEVRRATDEDVQRLTG